MSSIIFQLSSFVDEITTNILPIFTVVFLVLMYLYKKIFKSQKISDKNISHNFDKKRHLWGYVDTNFVNLTKTDIMLTGTHYDISGKTIHQMVNFTLKKMNIDFSDIDKKPIALDLDEIYKRLEKIKDKIGRSKQIHEFFKQKFLNESIEYSTKGIDILSASHGQTDMEIVEFHYMIPSDDMLLNKTVDCVFSPNSEQQILKFFEAVHSYNIKAKNSNTPLIRLIPRGGGTNVTRCLTVKRDPPNAELFISIDMSKYTGMISHDKNNNCAKFKSGTTGRQLEEELEKIGFICGHEPDSGEFSTLGGWIATNASGMKRGKYGNIEDIVTSIDIVVFDKSNVKIITFGSDLRTSAGPDISKVLFGSEGSLALITSATIKIKKLPEIKTYDSLVIPDWSTGVKFLKDVRESGELPASLRMVDNLQFQFGQALKPKKTYIGELVSKFQKKMLNMFGYDLNKICACTVVYEGNVEECKSTRTRLNKIAKKYKIMSGGSENGKAGYNLTNAIAYIRDYVNTLHIFGDTFECTVPWDKVETAGEQIIQGIRNIYAEEKTTNKSLKGEMFNSYRVTQLYETGVCMYFTYAYYCHNFENIEKIQEKIENSLKSTTLLIGATMSHHHGIGKLKQEKFLDCSSDKKDIIQKLKTVFDPANLLGSRNNYY